VRQTFAIIGSAIFLVIAPGFVAGLVRWWISDWRTEPPFLGLVLLWAVRCSHWGCLDCWIRSFGSPWQGIGTPAPIFATRHLVVTGLYRHVRNPMYIAVVAAIFGQCLIFGIMTVLEYVFCAEAPRWMPRVTPWSGDPNA
jgi:protein-S-isoprenylcysteine O-methyltransferase Ste14